MQPETTPPPTRARGRLVRARDDRVIAGVCGGLGRYLGVDPVLLRLAAAILVIFGGTGILAYIIAWIVVPEEPASAAGRQAAEDAGEPPADTDPDATAPVGSPRGATFVGVALIVLGVLLLADRVIPGMSWRFAGPVVLVAIGVLVLTKGGRR